MRKTPLLATILFALSNAVAAQTNRQVWKVAHESSLSEKTRINFDSHFKPAAYRFFTADPGAIKDLLASVPDEQTSTADKSLRIISIPDANGNMQRFRIIRTSVVSPQLASKYAAIQTYIGKGVDDPSAHLRFDYSPYGFHAMVSAANKPTYYINPVDLQNSLYIVNARNLSDKVTSFQCSLDQTLINKTDKTTTITGNVDDGKLRIYNLALCVNGEFSQAFLDGTETTDNERKTKVFAALVTCILRANDVYERDFGIRLRYAANEDTLIFLDPATDPWPARPPIFGSSWNSKTQSTIDARIGAANYDIGHLLGKVPTFGDNNGNAGCIGCVCADGSKGGGFSAYNDPTLIDYMVIDYWTHEMGHQFGANHTFTFSSENTQAQIEPGSGSTIMGYAGITGSTDVQPHSDDLFSIASIGQVASYTKTGNGSACPVIKNAGNTAPTADAGLDYTIPKSTPFLLTGSGSDIDSGDQLTYIWEQTDVFEKPISNTFPSPTSTGGPVFRVFNDSSSGVRSFPALPVILAGQTTSTWEALPSVSRTLNFRFTVRDNHISGGNNKSDNMTVTIDGSSGPFAVTQPNTAITINGGSQQTILWNVASSNLAPVNCNNVRISFSVDGGNTFAYTLAANTQNDGSELVTLPNISSTQCRVKIEAIGNIFFDISNTNFTITETSICPGRYDTSNNNTIQKSIRVPLNTDINGTINSSTDKDFYRFVVTSAGTYTITLKTLPANYNLVLINSSNTVIGSSSNTGITDETITSALSAGNYALRVNGKSGAFDDTNCYTLHIAPTATIIASEDAVIQKRAIQDGINGIKVYPNPATTSTTLSLKGNLQNAQIMITDISGRLLTKNSYNSLQAGQQITLPLQHFSKGTYFIKVNSDNFNKTEKLLIQ